MFFEGDYLIGQRLHPVHLVYAEPNMFSLGSIDGLKNSYFHSCHVAMDSADRKSTRVYLLLE